MGEKVTKGLVMNPNNETPMTFEEYGNDEWKPRLGSSEEFEWLMSLALDEALEPSEAERFEVLLREEPGNLDRWAAWQAVDNEFHLMPCVLPSLNFGEKFAQRLEIRERQRRLRTGFIFGVAAIALWGSALVGTVMLGALLWSNQSDWLGGLIYNVTYWWAALGHWGQALLNTGEALWAAPQTRAIVVCYIVAAIAILGGWLIFLRRSLRELPMAEAVMVEA
jgi:hypothetical protein